MIKIAIVEDDIQDQEKAKTFFERLSEESGEKFALSFFLNGDQFLFSFQYGAFDLVLMDIDLSSKDNGIEVSKKLRKIDEDVVLVFTTNLAQYAIEGYKVNAFNYIVKPYSYFDFSSQIMAIVSKINSQKSERILLQNDGIRAVVKIKDIYYVEISGHQMIYHTSVGDFKTYGSLKAVEKELKSFNFALCNSCFLVNLDYVERVDGYDVTVKGHKLLISHPRKKEFMKELSAYLGKC